MSSEIYYDSPFLFESSLFFTENETKSLSKCRIIQRNLVHFQGFPDNLYDEKLLSSFEYFGQYGTITKIVLNSKTDKNSQEKCNSAYITFEQIEQAAYCILSVDSIKIDNQLVRAFFGTTKYCNHFLNNYKCLNEGGCMFLHYLADPADVISENIKFGYSEHIKLAKQIIGFNSYRSKMFVMNCEFPKDAKLPIIKTIYHKENVLKKRKNHRRKISSSTSKSGKSGKSNKSNKSGNSTNNVSSNEGNVSSGEDTPTNNSSNGSNEFLILEKNEKFKSSVNIGNMYTVGKLFEAKEDSRFYKKKEESANDEKNLTYLIERNDISDNMKILIGNLTERLGLFSMINNYHEVSLNELEINFCKKIYELSKDNEIKSILEKVY